VPSQPPTANVSRIRLTLNAMDAARLRPRFLSDDEVRDYLGRVDVRQALKHVLRQLQEGRIEVAPRIGFGHGPLGEVTHIMAAKDLATRQVVTKLIDYDPSRPARVGKPSIIGIVTYLVGGEVIFLANASTFTNMRTASTTALAVDLLSPSDASVLTIFGAGPLAREHAIAIAAFRTLQEIRIVSRSGVSAERLAMELTGLLGSPVRASTASAREACAGADVVVTVTSAMEPILSEDDIEPGTLIAAIGSGIRERRELAGPLVGRAATIVVETLETAQSEAGDLILANAEGHLDWNMVVPMAELFRPDFRPDLSEIVIYKSVGAAWEDLACASAIADLLAGSPVAGHEAPSESKHSSTFPGQNLR
jgi:ornithine cyclodeaminase/alanine dehydrogenase-like protein (mu-crystallin family)